MSAQEYTLRSFNPGDFQDPHGNTWCDAAFEGISEPVKMVVKDPAQFKEGMELYGEITIATSKAGKPYNRFKRMQKPDQEQGYAPKAEKKEWQPRDDMAIRAQWAIGQAVSVYTASMQLEKNPIDDWMPLTEEIAIKLYAMVDRVKASQSQKEDGWMPSPEELAAMDEQQG